MQSGRFCLENNKEKTYDPSDYHGGLKRRNMAEGRKKNKKRNSGYNFALKGIAGIVKLLLLVLCVFGIIALGRSAYVFGYAVTSEKALEEAPGHNVVVDIDEDADIKEIAKALKNSGVIADANVFILQERISSYHGKLRGGNYRLNSSMTPEEIMEEMSYDEESGEESEA